MLNQYQVASAEDVREAPELLVFSAEMHEESLQLKRFLNINLYQHPVVQEKMDKARQIIRELEAAQEPLWSIMVLNGDGYGVLANHSLVMANYISRANAAIIELRQLLTQG